MASEVLSARESSVNPLNAVSSPIWSERRSKRQRHEALSRAKAALRRSDTEMPIRSESELAQNLYKGRLLRNNQARRAFIAHTYTFSELNAAKHIWNNPHELHFVRISPLGEGKDVSNPSDVKNLAGKRSRGVYQYGEYAFEYGHNNWVVKTEMFRQGFERLYHIEKAKR